MCDILNLNACATQVPRDGWLPFAWLAGSPRFKIRLVRSTRSTLSPPASLLKTAWRAADPLTLLLLSSSGCSRSVAEAALSFETGGRRGIAAATVEVLNTDSEAMNGAWRRRQRAADEAADGHGRARSRQLQHVWDLY